MFGFPKSRTDSLVLKDWNIVFHYTTFFPYRSIDLPKFLGRLVKSGLCEVAYHSKGVISWRDSGQAKCGYLEVKTHRDGAQYRSMNYKLPEGIQANPYAVEGAVQMCLLRFGELDLLHPTMSEGVDYVRGVLSPCIFEGAIGSVSLYPQITLYENGVLNVTYRLLSPKGSMPIDEFVENYLNFFRHHMDDLRLPPALMRLDTKNYLLAREVKDRSKALKEIQKIEDLIHNNARVESHGAFEHNLISVNAGTETGSDAPMNLDLLNSMVFSAVACVLEPPIQGWRFRWFGSKQRERASWGTWVGRPNIYIFSFENQPEKFSEIHQRHTFDLAKIAARTTTIPKNKAIEMLGESLRQFEDFGVYVNSALNLWVYSIYGLRSRGELDVNYNKLVYHFEAKAQFIDYVCASYQRLEERSFDDRATVSALSEDRREMYHLEGILAKPSKFGEVKDLFDSAFRVVELDRMRARVREGTSLSLERLREKRDYSRLNFEWLLIVVIGIFSANGLGKDLIQPLWKHFGLPVLYPKNLQGPFYICIVFVILSLVIVAIWISLQRQREER
jgi:hypothetical protein